MEIKSNGICIGKLIRASELFEEGLKFYSGNEERIQVGTWNYPKDTQLIPHSHNQINRTVTRTSEVIFVLAGSIHADIYDDNHDLLWEGELYQGDLLICLEGGHGYRTLEDITKVLEVKNGPYFGQDIDRRRIQNRCSGEISNNN
jgi:hypothetical protein